MKSKKVKEQDSKEQEVVQNDTVDTSAEENTSTDDVDGNIKKIEELSVKFNEVNDKYLRLYSEFDNFRKRTAREKADLISNASADVIKDLLPILDDFGRAIQNNENSDDISQIKEGFSLIQNKFSKILEAKGVKPMEAKEQAFDPELHEAITKIPAPTEELKGKVVDVIEQGYYLNERIIRYAKVVVGD